MLLIARRQSESVIINGNIEVKVIEIKGNRVKLGFEYPAGNTVYREEIFQKIQAENRSAMQQVDKSKLDDVLKKFSLSGAKTEPQSEEQGGNTLSPNKDSTSTPDTPDSKTTENKDE